MHEYDSALKLILQGAATSIVQQLTGVKIKRWLNAEMPQVLVSRVDLLGETEDGELIHIELQSSNDPKMALRMAEYTLRIYRLFGRLPRQIVLYVGDLPMRMNAFLTAPPPRTADFSFRFTLIDIRDLDSAALLASDQIEDNLLAILTRLQDRLETVREILGRIVELDEPAGRSAFAQLLIISGLRGLSPAVKEEAQKMPILNDILDHEVIGPLILQGRREGRREGRYEMLKALIEKRFGLMPAAIEQQLGTLSADELDQLALRIFDVSRLEELLAK